MKRRAGAGGGGAKPKKKKSKKSKHGPDAAGNGQNTVKDAATGIAEQERGTADEEVAWTSDEEVMHSDTADADDADDGRAQPALNRAEGRRKLLIVNKKIKEAAQNKQLGVALDEFARLDKLGLAPTVHTYTSMINACVRAGETERAIGYLKEMEEAGVAPNEVTYTAVIKGLAADADMEGVRKMLNTMRKKGQTPNVRTFDTILRGCVRAGDSKMAMAIWGAMQKEVRKLGNGMRHTVCVAARERQVSHCLCRGARTLCMHGHDLSFPWGMVYVQALCAPGCRALNTPTDPRLSYLTHDSVCMCTRATDKSEQPNIRIPHPFP